MAGEKKNLTKEEEYEIVGIYRGMSEEELLDVIRKKTEELGRLPTRNDIPGDLYFRGKYGPWPRVLEAAGVKPISEKRKRKLEAQRQKHIAMRQREKEQRAKRRAEREAAEAAEGKSPITK